MKYKTLFDIILKESTITDNGNIIISPLALEAILTKLSSAEERLRAALDSAHTDLTLERMMDIYSRWETEKIAT